MIERERRLSPETEAAQSLRAGNVSTAPIIPSARPVATVNLDHLAAPHDIARKLWHRTALLKPGTTVRVVVGGVWPPVHLPDVRTDLSYAIDSFRGDVSDAWIATLHRSGAEAELS